MSPRLDLIVQVTCVVVGTTMVVTLVGLLVAFWLLVADWRTESREAIKAHRALLEGHTTLIVQERQAFAAMLRDHQQVMRALERER